MACRVPNDQIAVCLTDIDTGYIGAYLGAVTASEVLKNGLVLQL